MLPSGSVKLVDWWMVAGDIVMTGYGGGILEGLSRFHDCMTTRAHADFLKPLSVNTVCLQMITFCFYFYVLHSVQTFLESGL